jgi:epoxyqueuosine reductase
MTELKLINIEEVASIFIENSPLNKMEALDSLKLFDSPLLAVANAHDPLFTRLTEEDAVGPQHMLPQEWLEDAKSVISYFLPFTKRVREANRTLGVAAKEWMYGRYEGEQFNNSLRKHLIQYLVNAGAKAVSPGIDPRFAIVNRRSNWSERHVAFVAGLGTFSLSRSLITRYGSAGRIGSVIVDFSIEPTIRQYTAMDEYCVKCGACILRCPPLAINEQGKDNKVCSDYLDRVLARYKPRYGCGKCQTSVPCEFKIPHAPASNISDNYF